MQNTSVYQLDSVVQNTTGLLILILVIIISTDMQNDKNKSVFKTNNIFKDLQ